MVDDYLSGKALGGYYAIALCGSPVSYSSLIAGSGKQSVVS